MAGSEYLRYLAALLFVLGLVALLAWLARRLRLGPMRLAPGAGPRLQVVETLPIDARRRLVMVRRDDVEHLLLLTQEGGEVVETGIPARTAGAAPAGAARC